MSETGSETPKYGHIPPAPTTTSHFDLEATTTAMSQLDIAGQKLRQTGSKTAKCQYIPPAPTTTSHADLEATTTAMSQLDIVEHKLKEKAHVCEN